MTLPRHARYKECSAPGIREVPDHWNVVPVKRVIQSIESGTSVNGSDRPAEDGEMGVLTTSCIQAGRFEPGENKAVVQADRHRVSCPLKAGTLIVSLVDIRPNSFPKSMLDQSAVDPCYAPCCQTEADSDLASLIDVWPKLSILNKATIQAMMQIAATRPCDDPG